MRRRGKALAEAREDEGLGLRELAEQVPISPGALSMIELGQRDPSLVTLARLGAALRADITVKPNGTIKVRRRNR
jgi:transcriptional regulator with XRE-family HTH domain